MAKQTGMRRAQAAGSRVERDTLLARRASKASGTGARARLHELFRDLSNAYERLASAAKTAGPLDARTVALVKVALSAGQGSWRGTHAHARKALEEGVSPDELRHLVAVALPTMGLAATLDALRWIDETIEEQEPAASR